jgi:hypothetical protein
MLRRTPLRAKSKPYKSAEVRRYHDWVASLPCLVTSQPGVTIHHVTGYANKLGRFTRSDWLVVPLSPEFHLIQHGPRWSVEALGHQGFYRVHGIDLYEEANRLAATYQRRAA